MNNEERNRETKANDEPDEVWIRYDPVVTFVIALILLASAIMCWFYGKRFVIFVVVPLIIYLFFHKGKRYCFSPNGVFVYTLFGYQQRRMSWHQITHLEKFSIDMQMYLIVSTMEKPLPKLVLAGPMQDYIRANSSRILQIPVKNKFFESEDYEKIVAIMNAAQSK